MKDFWNGLTPRTRQVAVAVIGVVVIASMYFGVFDQLVALVK